MHSNWLSNNDNSVIELELMNSDNTSESDLFIPKPQYTPSFCESVYAFCGRLQSGIYYVADFQPKLNYTIGVAAQFFSNSFMNSLPKNWPKPVLSTIPSTAITIGWNYLDAICGLVTAVRLLRDKEDYHQNENRVKAVIDILSSVQSLLLTYQPFITSLGGPTGLAGSAFATVMLADCINLSIDVVTISKKCVFLGWLEEALKEINYFDNLLHEDAIEQKTYADIRVKRANLISDIQLRCRVYYYQHETVDPDEDYDLTISGSTGVENRNRNELSAMQMRKKNINAIFSKYAITDDMINFIDCFSVPTTADLDRYKELQYECDELLRETSLNLISQTVSFVGMSLLALSFFYPALFMPGLMLVSGVSAMYLGQGVNKLKNLLQIAKESDQRLSVNSNSFFSDKNGQRRDDHVYVTLPLSAFP